MNSTPLIQNDRAGGSYAVGQPPRPPQKQPKALRFVTNYGAPHPKRRRVGAACMTCRKRKTACSGERPTCETCKQNKLECAGYSSETPATLGQKKSNTANQEQRPTGGSDDEIAVSHNKFAGSRPRPKNGHNIDPNLGVLGSENDERYPWARTPASPDGPSSRNSDRFSQCLNSGTETEKAKSLFPRPRDRMPYFRWLGPTAIMPGFKQMVVKVKRQETDPMARSSTNGEGAARLSPVTNDMNQGSAPRVSNAFPTVQTALDGEGRQHAPLPFYDNSPMPPSELITHLAHTFFTHLGCNYPFLQRERFLRDLEEKQVDAILVDAVCALSARFSTHPLLTSQTHLPPPGPPGQSDQDRLNQPTPAEYGHVFAQRAKSALVDTFACPSVAAVQAALLLAYLEFGESRDSGLWMYLGISIRMAQDLGLHTIEGLKYKGLGGPTPKIIRRESSSDSKKSLPRLSNCKASAKDKDAARSARETFSRTPSDTVVEKESQTDSNHQIEEQKAVEQERMDTFWAVFFLDRVVSSGTGRRSTLRDKDIELSFPALDEPNQKDSWPAPFPALIRIIHLYGRVADLLNGIKEPSDITSETSTRLAAMESQVTHFYQGLSARLHFDAVNFQHYVKAGEGTNFVLLHFWFHTLIVLLHRPTLFKTFEGTMLQLFPNSQQLSMSSAKTIADILSYSQLIDAKASLGNPFTSQPIYIAACAFLKETAEQALSSSAHSRASSPSRRTLSDSRPVSRPDSTNGTPQKNASVCELATADAASKDDEGSAKSTFSSDKKRTNTSPFSAQQFSDQQKSLLAKHTLLATAATQHYQLCYKALQSLETYWSGAKYILTILDQKFEGVEDPLLYTIEESESSMELPKPIPEFKSPGWRRKLIWDPSLPCAYLAGTGSVGLEIAQSPFWKARGGSFGDADPSKAIGWTLTGTINSPSTNLAWHYPTGTVGGMNAHQMPNMAPFHSAADSGYTQPAISGQDTNLQTMSYPTHIRAGSRGPSDPQISSVSMPPHPAGSGLSNVDAADLLLGLNNPYQSFRNSSPSNNTFPTPAVSHHPGAVTIGGNISFNHHSAHHNPHMAWMTDPAAMQPLGDMMIESQDVDMAMLGLDTMPWFDSGTPHDLTAMLDPRSLGAPHGRDGTQAGGNGDGNGNIHGPPRGG